MQGPYGWEPTATGFLQGGHCKGASATHFTIGTCKVKGDKLIAKAVMTTHGGKGAQRPLFGRYDTSFRISYKGKFKDYDYSLFSRALIHIIGADLAEATSLKIVDRQRTNQLLTEFELTMTFNPSGKPPEPKVATTTPG